MTGPDKAFRRGISFFELIKLIPDEETAIKWFESIFWLDGRRCPKCQGCNTYETNNSNGMRYWCRDCKRYFSVMTGTGQILSIPQIIQDCVIFTSINKPLPIDANQRPLLRGLPC
ncbi:MAG: transposase [Bacteroidetes bacterium]|nr:transposase [Bacteroidota bacterium]